MAAGGDKTETNTNTSKISEIANGVNPASESPVDQEELDNLNTILANLEKCVDQLDEKASNLTEKIKEFLEENQIDSEPVDQLIDQQKSEI